MASWTSASGSACSFVGFVRVDVTLGFDLLAPYHSASFSLPGDVGGVIYVDEIWSQEVLGVQVQVQGLPADADVSCVSSLAWKIDDENNRPPTRINSLLRGNGILAVFTVERSVFDTDIWVGTLRGEVKVFARPAVPAVPERAVPDLRALRGLGALSDVVLRAAGADFPVHKIVLAARSPVFLTMFTGAFKESQDKTVDVAVDCSAEEFGAFVEWLYSGALAESLGCSAALALLELAERYMVAELKLQCIHRLLTVGPGDALAVFKAALEQPHIPKEVGRMTAIVIKSNWKAVFGSGDAWDEFAAAQPAVALALEMLFDDVKDSA